MAKFLHTADWQLGKPFHQQGGRAPALRSAREDAVDRLGKVARERGVDFVLVAGDVFDANTVSDRVVTRACARLGEMGVDVYLLPGNHDFCGGPDSVYRRSVFQREKPDNVTVVAEATPVVVSDGEVVILPAPLTRRHTPTDPTRHITKDLGQEDAPDAIRIGLAHGGVLDFSEGNGQNVIDPHRAESANLDYLALGDWHGKWEVGSRTWYSGTPEPTHFRRNDQGFALVVEIERPGARPEIDDVQTGEYAWLQHEATLHGESDVTALERFFEDLDNPQQTLVRLEYEGVLNMDQKARLEQLLERQENLITYLRRRGPGVVPKPDEQELAEMTADGFVGQAVAELQDIAQSEGNQSESANRALSLLYQLQVQQEGPTQGGNS